MTGFLKGKRALITGVVSDRSIAYGIAQAMHQQGAELAFTYQSDKIKDRVADLVKDFTTDLLFPCDVSSDEEIENFANALGKRWDRLDILVHSIGFAPADQLLGDFTNAISREGFRIAHDVSAYSLAALAKAMRPLMENHKSAILTLTYLGADRAMDNYNVMGMAKASLEAGVRYLAASLGPSGIRVNGISAGPIKTLAAAGVKDLRKMLNWHSKVAPLRENVTTEQVGNTAAFLCSDLASGITGEIIFVDGGFHIMGMPSLSETEA